MRQAIGYGSRKPLRSGMWRQGKFASPAEPTGPISRSVCRQGRAARAVLHGASDGPDCSNPVSIRGNRRAVFLQAAAGWSLHAQTPAAISTDPTKSRRTEHGNVATQFRRRQTTAASAVGFRRIPARSAAGQTKCIPPGLHYAWNVPDAASNQRSGFDFQGCA
ncbi:hypothetical protein D3C73_608680 [compost metagenome]